MSETSGLKTGRSVLQRLLVHHISIISKPEGKPRPQRGWVRIEMEMTISKTQMVTRISFLVAGSVSGFSAAYLWLIPVFFNGYSTYSILILGVAIAGTGSGYICFKLCYDSSKTAPIVFSSLCGLGVATFVAVLSTLIIIKVNAFKRNAQQLKLV